MTQNQVVVVVIVIMASRPFPFRSFSSGQASVGCPDLCAPSTGKLER